MQISSRWEALFQVAPFQVGEATSAARGRASSRPFTEASVLTQPPPRSPSQSPAQVRAAALIPDNASATVEVAERV